MHFITTVNKTPFSYAYALYFYGAHLMTLDNDAAGIPVICVHRGSHELQELVRFW